MEFVLVGRVDVGNDWLSFGELNEEEEGPTPLEEPVVERAVVLSSFGGRVVQLVLSGFASLAPCTPFGSTSGFKTASDLIFKL